MAYSMAVSAPHHRAEILRFPAVLRRPGCGGYYGILGPRTNYLSAPLVAFPPSPRRTFAGARHGEERWVEGAEMKDTE